MVVIQVSLSVGGGELQSCRLRTSWPTIGLRKWRRICSLAKKAIKMNSLCTQISFCNRNWANLEKRDYKQKTRPTYSLVVLDATTGRWWWKSSSCRPHTPFVRRWDYALGSQPKDARHLFESIESLLSNRLGGRDAKKDDEQTGQWLFWLPIRGRKRLSKMNNTANIIGLFFEFALPECKTDKFIGTRSTQWSSQWGLNYS